MKESLDMEKAAELETAHVAHETSPLGQVAQKEPQEPLKEAPVLMAPEAAKWHLDSHLFSSSVVEADILLMPTLPLASPSPLHSFSRRANVQSFTALRSQPIALLRPTTGSMSPDSQMLGSVSASFRALNPAREGDIISMPPIASEMDSPGLPSLRAPVLGTAQSFRLQSPRTLGRRLFGVDVTSDTVRRVDSPAASSPALLGGNGSSRSPSLMKGLFPDEGNGAPRARAGVGEVEWR